MKEPGSISLIVIMGFIIVILLVFSVIFIQETRVQRLKADNAILLTKIDNLDYIVRTDHKTIVAQNIKINNLYERWIGKKNYTVFLGDSITKDRNWSSQFPGQLISNSGVGSDTTAGVLNRIYDIVSEKPDRINLMVGINDLGRGSNIPAIVTRYDSILDIISKESPKTKIYIFSILPVNHQMYDESYPTAPVRIDNHQVAGLNSQIQQLSKNYPNTQYVDLYPHFIDDRGELQANLTADGIHLSDQGYIVWEKIIGSTYDTDLSQALQNG